MAKEKVKNNNLERKGKSTLKINFQVNHQYILFFKKSPLK